jgi:hypothetical protein
MELGQEVWPQHPAMALTAQGAPGHHRQSV